eukprot:8443542-Pyramimonas_sp.AAC.1
MLRARVSECVNVSQITPDNLPALCLVRNATIVATRDVICIKTLLTASNSWCFHARSWPWVAHTSAMAMAGGGGARVRAVPSRPSAPPATASRTGAASGAWIEPTL